MHNLKLLLTYDGTNYLGWQKTPSGASIESFLQTKIEQILQHPTPLQAASRTDAGVHAQAQVVNFLTSKTCLDLKKFCISLNRLLPKDIVVLKADWMPLSFHPTLDSKSKEYHYFLCYGPTQLPQHRFYSWHVPFQLNIEDMQQACSLLKGTHDFASFCNQKNNVHYTDFIRQIQSIEINLIDDHRLVFRIRGNHFLYKMVRNIVGTLVDIGKGKLRLDDIPTILQSRLRPKAGVTAPPQGLFLHKVFYDFSFT